MVSSEALPLTGTVRRDTHHRGNHMRWVAIAAVVSAALVGVVVLTRSGMQEETTELFAKHVLNAEEQRFVAKAMRTPDVDLHRAKQFRSEDGAKDMDSFYDSLGKQLAASAAKRKNHHVQADTKAAKKDINNYFDQMKQTVEQMNAEEHKKQAGTGRQALKNINGYFDGLAASQAAKNEEDIVKLSGAVQKVKKGKSVAEDQNPLLPVQGVMPKHALSTTQGLNDINSYFDDLDKAQSTINEGDRKRLSNGNKPYKSIKLSAQEGLKDLDKYFDQETAAIRPLDSNDLKNLRKDNSPANSGNGVRVAFEQGTANKLAQVKVLAHMKRAKTALKAKH